ncbi:MAG: hypothetical protein C0614_00770 [Desulfuromonas sp.]|nr:MAG: hypothetical protein C0614_00770 [Desulfuromonas sp.]
MNGRDHQAGMALLLVVVLVALLSSLLVELAFSTLIDLRLTETFRDSTKAYYLAKGGVNAGRMLLQEDRNDYDGRDETWSLGVTNYPVSEGTVSIAIEDLDSKLSINALVNGDNPQTVMVDRFYRYFSAMQIEHLADPAELTAALIDWLDSGDAPYRLVLTDGAEIAVAGAEQSSYSGGEYPCKNGLLDTLDELGLVSGFTPQVLERVREHLSTGDSLSININTASREVLMSLDSLIDPETAESIIAFRREQPIRNLNQLEELLDAETFIAIKTLGNLQQVSTTSDRYRIDSLGRVNDGQSRLRAEVDKRNNQLLSLKVN